MQKYKLHWFRFSSGLIVNLIDCSHHGIKFLLHSGDEDSYSAASTNSLISCLFCRANEQRHQPKSGTHYSGSVLQFLSLRIYHLFVILQHTFLSQQMQMPARSSFPGELSAHMSHDPRLRSAVVFVCQLKDRIEPLTAESLSGNK